MKVVAHVDGSYLLEANVYEINLMTDGGVTEPRGYHERIPIKIGTDVPVRDVIERCNNVRNAQANALRGADLISTFADHMKSTIQAMIVPPPPGEDTPDPNVTLRGDVRRLRLWLHRIEEAAGVLAAHPDKVNVGVEIEAIRTGAGDALRGKSAPTLAARLISPDDEGEV